MVLPIYTYGEEFLTRKCQDVFEKPELADIKAVIRDEHIPNMFETMYNAKGAGLAANQVGLGWRIVIIDVEIADGVVFKGVFINPHILSYSGSIYPMSEGCLSVPGIKAIVDRPFSVEVEYDDEDWVHHKEIFGGIKSRVLQHEIDHLDGILFINRIDISQKEKILFDLVNIKQKKVKTSYLIK
jgi:peptide deformylase